MVSFCIRLRILPKNDEFQLCSHFVLSQATKSKPYYGLKYKTRRIFYRLNVTETHGISPEIDLLLFQDGLIKYKNFICNLDKKLLYGRNKTP